MEERGVVKKDGEGNEVELTAETSTAATAEHAKAMIQAKFTVALNRPRDVEDVRVRMLHTCKRPRFAKVARYLKPIGKELMPGPSVHFADEAIKLYGNVDVQESVVYEDGDKRMVQVTVLDLEACLSKSKTITVSKTIERRKVRPGQEVLGSRENTYGDTVYIVRATDDEVRIKEAAMCSICRRNLELQILPRDIVDECMDVAEGCAQSEYNTDPKEALHRMLDAFSGIGVKPIHITKYIGHELDYITPGEIDDLRQIFQAIKEGECTWAEVMTSVNEGAEANGEESAKAAKVAKKIKDKKEKKKDTPKRENYAKLCELYGTRAEEIDAELTGLNMKSLLEYEEAEDTEQLEMLFLQIIEQLD